MIRWRIQWKFGAVNCREFGTVISISDSDFDAGCSVRSIRIRSRLRFQFEEELRVGFQVIFFLGFCPFLSLDSNFPLDFHFNFNPHLGFGLGMGMVLV